MDSEFYTPISLSEITSGMERATRYTFIENVKENGLAVPDTFLFAQSYRGKLGNSYFIWKEDERHDLSERARLIKELTGGLPKYFSM